VTKEGIKEQFCFWIGNTGWKNIVEGMVLVLRDYNEMKHTSITSRNLSIVCHSCRRVVSLEEYMNNSGMCRDCAEKKKVETNGVWEAFGGDDKWKKLKNQ
jgi:acetyl-CoA carboxylase beta subunit